MHAAVRVAVLLVAGFGCVVVRGAELAAVVGFAAAVAVGCFLRGAVLDAVGDAAADAEVAEVGIGGDCEPCTSTFDEPLLHAVTASITPSPAASAPNRPLSSVPMPA